MLELTLFYRSLLRCRKQRAQVATTINCCKPLSLCATHLLSASICVCVCACGGISIWQGVAAAASNHYLPHATCYMKERKLWQQNVAKTNWTICMCLDVAYAYVYVLVCLCLCWLNIVMWQQLSIDGSRYAFAPTRYLTLWRPFPIRFFTLWIRT